MDNWSCQVAIAVSKNIGSVQAERLADSYVEALRSLDQPELVVDFFTYLRRSDLVKLAFPDRLWSDPEHDIEFFLHQNNQSPMTLVKAGLKANKKSPGKEMPDCFLVFFHTLSLIVSKIEPVVKADCSDSDEDSDEEEDSDDDEDEDEEVSVEDGKDGKNGQKMCSTKKYLSNVGMRMALKYLSLVCGTDNLQQAAFYDYCRLGRNLLATPTSTNSDVFFFVNNLPCGNFEKSWAALHVLKGAAKLNVTLCSLGELVSLTWEITQRLVHPVRTSQDVWPILEKGLKDPSVDMEDWKYLAQWVLFYEQPKPCFDFWPELVKEYVAACGDEVDDEIVEHIVLQSKASSDDALTKTMEVLVRHKWCPEVKLAAAAATPPLPSSVSRKRARSEDSC